MKEFLIDLHMGMLCGLKLMGDPIIGYKLVGGPMADLWNEQLTKSYSFVDFTLNENLLSMFNIIPVPYEKEAFENPTKDSKGVKVENV